MKNLVIGILTWLMTGWFALAQNYIPQNYRQAIANGTRTAEGIPGPLYFQNSSDYQMDVQFTPRNGMLQGRAKIIYTNNSPDSLTRIVMRLYQNIYSRGARRDDPVDKSLLHDGMQINRLFVDDQDMLADRYTSIHVDGTLMTLFLDEALVPDDQLHMDINWKFQVPQEEVRRFGKYDKGSYFVAMWYPQIAVYDDLEGWDYVQYTGSHEFYNDFNSYDIRIELPSGYMVWAGGELMNEGEIFSDRVLAKLYLAKNTDTVISVIGKQDFNKRSWRKSWGKQVFYYLSDSTPDFAFGVSDRYVWDAGSILVDTIKGGRIHVSAAYPYGSPHFHEVTDITRKAVLHMSTTTYRVPYPFQELTVFKGADGMEYPMIINNGAMHTRSATTYLAMHEIAHAYFPFLTGINEHKYSWIDEGLTSYLPLATGEELNTRYYDMDKMVRQYNRIAGTDKEISLAIPAFLLRGKEYQYYSYHRPAVAFSMLEAYMGRDDFRAGMQEFIEVWQYKHATPYDLFAILAGHSSRDIQWVINSWFFEPGWPDLAIGNVTYVDGELQVDILNKGTRPVPVKLEVKLDNGSIETLEHPMQVWRNTDSLRIKRRISSRPILLKLGTPDIPDKYLKNNSFTPVYP